jgi:hypothetical protein
MGYAIMSSTITGMGPLLKPFDQEYKTSYKSYEHSSHRANQPDSSLNGSRLRPRTSTGGLSQSYLMETIPSRRGSKASIPDSRITSASPEPTHALSAPSSQAPLALTADEHFRPAHMYKGHEAEVWVEHPRSMTADRDEVVDAGMRSRGNKLVIGKKKEFKVEVDRASRGM